MPFVERLLDSGFCAPMLETPEQLKQNLLSGFDHPQDFVLGCEESGTLTGVFSLMAEPGEGYLEMMLALSEEEEACTQALAFLRQHASGMTLDCVIHPSSWSMYDAFRKIGGQWEPVQQKLRLMQPAPVESAYLIQPCGEAHRTAYAAMHTTDCYWTAQRVLAAPDRFIAYVALLEGQMVGYLDVTKGFAENEVYDWQVQEKYRNRGIGAALLSEAVRLNGDCSMVLLCGEDEKAALKAARKVGFAAVEGAQSITGRMVL